MRLWIYFIDSYLKSVLTVLVYRFRVNMLQYNKVISQQPHCTRFDFNMLIPFVLWQLPMSHHALRFLQHTIARMNLVPHVLQFVPFIFDDKTAYLRYDIQCDKVIQSLSFYNTFLMRFADLSTLFWWFPLCFYHPSLSSASSFAWRLSPTNSNGMERFAKWSTISDLF